MFISIMDEGVGIVPELLERIFDISFTEVVKIKSPETGFGLGLPIVKELVEDHGGFVIVNSKVGKGSTFTIVLPVYNVSMEFQIALKNEIRKAKRNNNHLAFIFLEITEHLNLEVPHGRFNMKERLEKFVAPVITIIPRENHVLVFQDLGTILFVVENQPLSSLAEKIDKLIELFRGQSIMISVASYPEDGVDEDQIILNRRRISG